MKTWIDDLRSGLARKAQADRIAGGKTGAGIGAALRRHYPFFLRHWRKGALGSGLILLNVLLAFPMPLFSRFAIDDVILGRDLPLLPWVLLLMVAVALCVRGIGLFQNYFFLRYSQEVSLDIQQQVLDHAFRLPKSFFDRHQTSYLMARVSGDLNGVTWFLSGSLVAIVENSLRLIGGLAFLFYLEWRLALAALAILPVFALSLRFCSDRMNALNHAGNEEKARYMSCFQETLSSVPLVKAYAAEESAVTRIMSGLRQVFQVSAERSVVASLTGLMLSSTPSLVNFMVFAIGAVWVITGHWSLGSLFAFQAYLGYVFGPAASLSHSSLQVQNIRASLERLAALLDVVPDEKPAAARGAALGLNPDWLTAPDRTQSPALVWHQLRSSSSTQKLSDEQVWDLVALMWRSNTTPERLTEGQQLYAQNCAACHGETGKGDGVIAPSLKKMPVPGMTMTGHETVAPINFTDAKNLLGASDAILEGKIIRGGMGTGMPYWGPIFTTEQIRSLVDYLWTFQFDQ